MTDISQDTGTTGVLELNSSLTNTLETNGDQDWFKIELTAGDRVRFDLEGSTSGNGTLFDPLIAGIYDSTGTLIPGTTDDDVDWATNPDSVVEFEATYTGTYYVSAAAYNWWDYGIDNIGTYTLTATAMLTDDYASDRSTLGTLALGGSTTGDIEVANDQDWFKISLAEGQIVQFDLEGAPTGGGTLADTYFMGVYDTDGSLIAGTKNDDGGYQTNSRVEYTASYTGDYYVSASAFGSYTGTYTMSATDLGMAPPPGGSTSDDFSQDLSTTGVITATTGASVTGNIETSGDLDWFKINLAAGQNVVIDMEGTPTLQGTLVDTRIMGIHDSTGQLLNGTGNDDGGIQSNSRVNFTALYAGDYYISAGAFGSYTGTYTMSIRAPDDFAANTGTTGVLNPDGNVIGDIQVSGDQDWFRLDLTAGQTVLLDLEGSPTGQGTLSDPYLKGIYNSGGSLISGYANDDSGYGANSQVLFQAASTGAFYVSVGASGHGMGSYRLSSDTMSGYNIIAGDSDANGLFGTAAADFIYAGGGNDIMHSSFGNDIVFGGDGNDEVCGCWNNDKLIGGDGDDFVAGYENDDVLIGGDGNDQLEGGTGSDAFVFHSPDGGLDTILDFTAGEDKIQVLSVNFGGLTVGALGAGSFVAGSTATGSGPTFLYDSGNLSFDADGTGSMAAVQIAELTGNPTLTAADIEVIAAM